jgi:hypothetical protein
MLLKYIAPHTISDPFRSATYGQRDYRYAGRLRFDEDDSETLGITVGCLNAGMTEPTGF